MAALLEVEDLQVSYRADRGDLAILNGVSLRVSPGETIGVVHHVALIPGLTYYAGGQPGRFEDLPDHAAIEEFLRSGRGQVLVSEVRRNWALEPAPHAWRAEFRSGDRRIWVLAPPGRDTAVDRHRPGRHSISQPPAGA